MVYIYIYIDIYIIIYIYSQIQFITISDSDVIFAFRDYKPNIQESTGKKSQPGDRCENWKEALGASAHFLCTKIFLVVHCVICSW